MSDLIIRLPSHSLRVMIGVLVLLAVASLAGLVLAGPHREGGKTGKNEELRLRINSWWWMILILFGVLVLGRNASIVFLAMISFLALKEFFSIVPTRMADRRVIFWSYLAIPLQYYWASTEWYGMFIIFIPVYTFMFLLFRMVLTGETRGFIHSAGIIHLGVMLCVYNLSHLAYLLVLPVKNYQAGNIGLLLFVLFMTEANDVGQYVWGKSLGRHKIVPKISPNKTWEGFLGGFFTISMASALLAPYLTPLDWQKGLLAGMIMASAGFTGDVVMSVVKRDLLIKDSGTLIPGHGGILDRLDSLTYSAPLFFHFLYYIAY